jgi:hypothetical protein
MSDQAQERGLGRALEAFLSEQPGAERYRRYQREIRSGKARTGDGARPQEFDARGFPVEQRSPSFVERVARLLAPS